MAGTRSVDAPKIDVGPLRIGDDSVQIRIEQPHGTAEKVDAGRNEQDGAASSIGRPSFQPVDDRKIRARGGDRTTRNAQSLRCGRMKSWAVMAVRLDAWATAVFAGCAMMKLRRSFHWLATVVSSASSIRIPSASESPFAQPAICLRSLPTVS